MPLNKRELAARYGWSYSFLKSNNELWGLFNRAVDRGYSPQRFVAELRDTGWYRKHGEAWRKNQLLKKTDPGTYRQRVQEKTREISDIATQMGVDLPRGGAFRNTAEMAMAMGWNDSHIRDFLSRWVDEFSQTGHYGGQAGEAENELRKYAWQMGVRLSEQALEGHLQNIVSGRQTTEDYKALIQSRAESAFPALANNIRQGQTVMQTMDPYMQTMGSVLEIDPNSLTPFDPQIRRAMHWTPSDNKETGSPEIMPMWQFETELRNDPRWLNTDNARKSLMGTARGVLQQMGVAF